MSGSGSRSVVDFGVGSIVWVRRRNGSWWPGMILGPDDISTKHLMSPRSGTPVKLLGREDASIDWYNLEKSKRVKAFRCGEFDDDIERAEASEELTPKKREKYARREDAILHALQLEGQLEKEVSNRSSGTVKKESSPLSEELRINDGNFVIPETPRKPNSEDDLETVPRTKGLRDFGLRITPSKRKFSSTASNDTCEVNSNSQALPDDVSHLNTRETNGIMGAVIGPGKSKCASLPTDLTVSVEDSKDISFSLVKMVPPQLREDNHPHSGSAVEVNAVRVLEEPESDSSDNESDSAETEPEIDDRVSVHSDVSLPMESNVNTLRRPGAHALYESLSSEDYDASPFSREMTNNYSHDHVSGSETVAKWKLKGKRNIRNVRRRPGVATGGRGNTFTGFSLRIPGQSSNHYRKDDYIDDDDNDDGTDFYPEDAKIETVGADSREYMFTPRSISKYGYRPGRELLDWESVWEDDQNALEGHWEDRSEQSNLSHHYYGYRMSPILIDVDLKVQGAGYQKGSVPMKSLVSKISGRPAVGHPIQIDVLEDGSTEDMISNNVGSDYEMIDYDGIATLPLSWKTGRRTAKSRVPRSHVLSEYGEGRSPSDPEREEHMKKFSTIRKSHTNTSHPVNSRLPGERTSTLSSVTTDQKFSNKHMHGCSSSQMDGPNNPQSPGPRSVASIPCKLVFSRLLEKISKPSS